MAATVESTKRFYGPNVSNDNPYQIAIEAAHRYSLKEILNAVNYRSGGSLTNDFNGNKWKDYPTLMNDLFIRIMDVIADESYSSDDDFDDDFDDGQLSDDDFAAGRPKNSRQNPEVKKIEYVRDSVKKIEKKYESYRGSSFPYGQIRDQLDKIVGELLNFDDEIYGEYMAITDALPVHIILNNPSITGIEGISVSPYFESLMDGLSKQATAGKRSRRFHRMTFEIGSYQEQSILEVVAIISIIETVYYDHYDAIEIDYLSLPKVGMGTRKFNFNNRAISSLFQSFSDIPLQVYKLNVTSTDVGAALIAGLSSYTEDDENYDPRMHILREVNIDLAESERDRYFFEILKDNYSTLRRLNPQLRKLTINGRPVEYYLEQGVSRKRRVDTPAGSSNISDVDDLAASLKERIIFKIKKSRTAQSVIRSGQSSTRPVSGYNRSGASSSTFGQRMAASRR